MLLLLLMLLFLLLLFLVLHVLFVLVLVLVPVPVAVPFLGPVRFLFFLFILFILPFVVPFVLPFVLPFSFSWSSLVPSFHSLVACCAFMSTSASIKPFPVLFLPCRGPVAIKDCTVPVLISFRIQLFVHLLYARYDSEISCCCEDIPGIVFPFAPRKCVGPTSMTHQPVRRKVKRKSNTEAIFFVNLCRIQGGGATICESSI